MVKFFCVITGPFFALLLLAGGASAREPLSELTYAALAKIERPRILSKAAIYLETEPRTVVHDIAERSEGGHHDFYSEGDYWWPNPEDIEGPYVRRDGETNPDNFVAHRRSMRRLSEIVASLTSAYLLTEESKYASAAARHLHAWFVHEGTRMNPSLLFGQAIKGRFTGRSIGIIDTIHLVEVARSAKLLSGAPGFNNATEKGVKDWFQEYLTWINRHPYGLEEKVHPNNHGVTWSMQAAVFADLVGDQGVLTWVRNQFKAVYLEEMMDAKGGFPAELARTKPYGYALFVIDAMAGLAQVASTEKDNLWTYRTPQGRSMALGMEFILPYIRDKSDWPYPKDVQYWDDWPVRHPSVLFAAFALERPEYVHAWLPFEADPKVPEVQRNLPIRHPLLWLER